MAIPANIMATLDLSQFHFIRPALLILLPAVVVLWLMVKRGISKSGWEQYLPKETIRVLQVNGRQQSSGWQWCFLAAAIILCFAAAGPTWVKQPVPTLQNQQALVVLLDLSPSMLAQDLKPDRLTRAKYKLIDILRQYQDGQIALIAYAGDAHTVSPLTDDPKTLEALLPALHPAIMPSRGSNTEAAFALAQQLLRDAQLSSGDILLITDGVAPSAVTRISNDVSSGVTLSIMGVGGSEAAPIPAGTGGFLRGRDGEIILSSVNEAELKQFSNQLGGRYARLNSSDQDVKHLLPKGFQTDSSTEQLVSENTFDSWSDMGHWLLLLVLPFAAWCFRRGLIYCLPLFFLVPAERSWANETTQADAAHYRADGFSWTSLWQTPDQRAQASFENEQYSDAAKTFEREDWRAVANYKNGDFAAAAEQLQGATDVASLYNKGNALAMNGDLEQALKAYEQALAAQPEHADAQHNKDIIDKLLQQSQQQDQNQSSDEQDSQNSEQKSENDSSEPSADSEKEEPSADSQNKEPSAGSEDKEPSADSQDNDSSTDSTGEKEQETSESAEQESSESDAEEKTDESNQSEEQALGAEQANEASDSEQDTEQQNIDAMAEESSEPLKDASEQWLRGIKDDPSGLLRRKFQYQAEQKKRSAPQSNSTEERY